MPSLYERALALHEEGRDREALAIASEAMKVEPLNAEIWRLVAYTAIRAGQPEVAKPLLEMYVKVTPDAKNARLHLGRIYLRGGEPRKAEPLLRSAYELGKRDSGTLRSWGIALALVGRHDEADARFREALALPPETSDAEEQQALLRIGVGDFDAGWRTFHEVSARRPPQTSTTPPRDIPPERYWNGEPMPGGTLCLTDKGGVGDIIMFARFFPALAERVGRLVMVGRVASLLRLLAQVPGFAGEATTADLDAPSTRFLDVWSLPFVSGATRASVGAMVPYLHAPASGPQLPPRAHGAVVRVGLVWAGSPQPAYDWDRSLPHLGVLDPLLAVDGVEWVSLQVGQRAEEAAGRPLLPCPPLADFADTAHVLAQLDLVIAVDSSVANLAGALGVPVWLFRISRPEVRWPSTGERSFWYPTARMFRRRSTEDWDGVAAAMTRALEAHVRERRERRESGAVAG